MKLISWSTTLAYAGFLFYLSSRPWPAPSLLPFFMDKIVHMFLYFPLGFLLFWSLRTTHLSARLLPPLALFLALLYGASDELHQAFVPGREASLWDIVADGVGSGLGILAVAWRGKLS